jgi:hypothetical protein
VHRVYSFKRYRFCTYYWPLSEMLRGFAIRTFVCWGGTVHDLPLVVTLVPLTESVVFVSVMAILDSVLLRKHYFLQEA